MDGIDITSQGDATIGGDAVGRDKITHSVTQQFFGDQAKPRPVPRMAPPVPKVFVGRDEALRELIAALGCSDTRGRLSVSPKAIRCRF